MASVYESDSFSVSYEADCSAAIVVLKQYNADENYRIALMQGAEFLRKSRCTNLIVESRTDVKLSEHDMRWMKKIFLLRLDRIGCRKIILILGKEKAADYPKYLRGGRITVLAASGMEEAFAMANAGSEEIKEPSKAVDGEKESSMTKEEAFAFFGLTSEATNAELEDKFWQMSKVYSNDRNMDPDEKARALDHLSDVYDIASGRRAERIAQQEREAAEKKFLGKSFRQWKLHFYYSWYKYLIGIVVILVAADLVYTMFFKPKVDCGVFSAGHFYYEEIYVEKMLMNDMGYRNPYVNSVDVAVPNNQGQVSSDYGDQIAVTGFLSNPNIFVTDEMSVAYFFDEMTDCSAIYYALEDVLTPEQYAKITPVYLSPHDAYEASNIYADVGLSAGEAPEDDTDIMVGLMINDSDFMHTLGYYNLWPDTEDSLVFTVYASTPSMEDSQRILAEIFSRM